MLIRIPKVRSKTSEVVTFRSALVPPHIRKTRRLEPALRWSYSKGVSSGEIGPALEVLVGPEAQRLSASTGTRKKQTCEDHRNWSERHLDRNRWIYVWEEGFYSHLRAEQTTLCALVDHWRERRWERYFLAIEDGVRETTQSW